MVNLVCVVLGHMWETRHRVAIEPDDGGWGLHFLGPDPVARLLQACGRCGARRIVNEYPADNSTHARWMRGEDPDELTSEVS